LFPFESADDDDGDGDGIVHDVYHTRL